MWLKKLRRLIRLFFFQLTGKKGDKVAKLTKPVIAVNIDGTVRVLNQDPNATHFNWYTRELLSYNITSPSYDTVVAGTNESTTALPNSSYTNRVYITESYRDIRKFTSFKLYEAGSSAVDVTELYVTKISDFEYSISIPNVEHDYIITWGVGAVTYTITSSLTNCVADKSDESYVGGTAVNIIITAATGYTFDSSLGGTIGLSVGEVDKTSEYMTRSSDNKKVTIAIPAIAAVGNIIYAAGAVEEITQLATPTIAMNADGKTLEITDVANATSYDVYVDGTMKTNVASVPNTTTLDLSTLSDIADGTHTVKVKAKADGYIDSEFSNEVSYTKETVLSGNHFLDMKFSTNSLSGNYGVDIHFYNEQEQEVAYVEFWRNVTEARLSGRVNKGATINSELNATKLKLDVDFYSAKCKVKPWGGITGAYAGTDYGNKRTSLPINKLTTVYNTFWESTTFAVSVYK